MLGAGRDMRGAEVARGQQRRGTAVPASLQGNRGLQNIYLIDTDKTDQTLLNLASPGRFAEEILALSVWTTLRTPT